ncbi:excisionase family DNA-binding protein [Sphingobium ummariense]|nr:excisionase family DNA-binding protein [Sphingobium ummariense]
MSDDILTTTQAARLLGVSVRTAQLLIEGGSLPSWKTPGGHRRVYRRDVEAIIAGNPATTERPSAILVVLAGGALREEIESAASSFPEFTIVFAANRSAALLAIGERKPAALILGGSDPALLAGFVATIADETDLAADHVILITKDGLPREMEVAGVKVVTSGREAVAAMRELLSDPPQVLEAANNLPYPVALNEQQRLVALERSGLIDSAPEETFDRIAWLAANNLEAPIALVTLLTPTRQFFKARIGLDMTDTPRSWAFCNYTIMQNHVFAVEDLSQDPRFEKNPAVACDGGFRFYAGAPIRDDMGFAVGSLCIIDLTARRLNQRQTETLAALAHLGGVELRLREAKRQLQDPKRQIGRSNPKREAGTPVPPPGR